MKRSAAKALNSADRAAAELRFEAAAAYIRCAFAGDPDAAAQVVDAITVEVWRVQAAAGINLPTPSPGTSPLRLGSESSMRREIQRCLDHYCGTPRGAETPTAPRAAPRAREGRRTRRARSPGGSGADPEPADPPAGGRPQQCPPWRATPILGTIDALPIRPHRRLQVFHELPEHLYRRGWDQLAEWHRWPR